MNGREGHRKHHRAEEPSEKGKARPRHAGGEHGDDDSRAARDLGEVGLRYAVCGWAAGPAIIAFVKNSNPPMPGRHPNPVNEEAMSAVSEYVRALESAPR